MDFDPFLTQLPTQIYFFVIILGIFTRMIDDGEWSVCDECSLYYLKYYLVAFVNVIQSLSWLIVVSQPDRVDNGIF